MLLVVAAALAARGEATATPPAAAAADPVLVGAGDIANCLTSEDQATARLLDGIEGTVVTLGDNTYPDGSTANFANCYAPTWGRHRTRTRPAPGNHDYVQPGAGPYFAYFGANAGPDRRGYYSYSLGAWQVVSLNSNIVAYAGSPQERWLRDDLAVNPAACTLAYWHHATFSSGRHGDDPQMRAIWRALYEHGADVVLAGHDHHYERLAPMDADGRADPARGIRSFVVGTGGTSLRSLDRVRANSEDRNASTHGILKLTLRPTGYDWEFVPIAGGSFRDSGSTSCVRVAAERTATPEPTDTPTSSPSPTATATATPTPEARGNRRTARLRAVSGWDGRAQQPLSAVVASDDERLGVEPGQPVVFEFEGGIPPGARIRSARLAVEHYEEPGYPARALTWEIGGGPLANPAIVRATRPPIRSGERREATTRWNVTAWADTPAWMNDLKLVVRNQAASQRTWIDYVELVVTYE